MTDLRQQLINTVEQGYRFEGKHITLGTSIFDRVANKGNLVKIPLSTLNRHGLIAGATGTGKTKTLQILAEQLSQQGVPSLIMDIKGDLSGIAMPSDGHPKIDERHELIDIPFIPDFSPVELMSLSADYGIRLRATVSEFGPILFSKILNLNDIQSGIISVVFKYCDDKRLPLLDLKDLQKVLVFMTNEGKEEVESIYGRISKASIGAIMRKMIELEQQGADLFFGEPSFEVEDLLRVDQHGRGIVHILRVTDIQDKPKLFSSFMLQLLAEIYTTFPEEGDLEKPKLAVFIDEAHLIFDQASSVLLDQIESIIKLIRSKGIGIFFVTQNPVDIPDEILGQLGLKIQHALRAFTAKDRKAIRLAAQNFPETKFYKIDQLLTQMGIGEAMVSVLDEDGIPTPLVHTLLRAPQSRMDVLSRAEIQRLLSRSALYAKYSQSIDRESAYEILNEKIAWIQEKKEQERLRQQEEKMYRRSGRRRSNTYGAIERVLGRTTTRQIGRTIARELTRGLLGVLGAGGRRRRKRY